MDKVSILNVPWVRFGLAILATAFFLPGIVGLYSAIFGGGFSTYLSGLLRGAFFSIPIISIGAIVYALLARIVEIGWGIAALIGAMIAAIMVMIIARTVTIFSWEYYDTLFVAMALGAANGSVFHAVVRPRISSDSYG